MLYAGRPPGEKRVRLREMLQPGAAVQFPGAFTPLSVKLVEEAGFEGVYVSGAVMANELGLPDIGLTTLSEVATRAGQIARMTELPCLVDADTGFGEPLNLARSIAELEAAGLAGCHIEDQENPKRCGHLDGKSVVDTGTAVRRIRAAVDARTDPNFLVMARTDLRGVDGLTAAIDRMKVLVDAGADAIFPEAMVDLGEFEKVCAALDVPVLANMTEFGKSELFTRDQLAAAGIALVIYPVTLLRTALGAMERTLATIRKDGTQQAAVGEMLTRARLYELVDYEAYGRFDSDVFTFDLTSNQAVHTDLPPTRESKP